MSKEHNKSLKSLYPDLFTVRCGLMIKNYDEKRDKDELIKMYEELSFELLEKTNTENIKQDSLALMNLLEINKLVNRFDFEQTYPLAKDLHCIISFYKIHQERKSSFDLAQEEKLISLYDDFNSSKSIHPRVVGAYFNSISNLTIVKDQLNKRELFLKKRYEIIANTINPVVSPLPV